jgi:hypothetical protein
VTHLIKDLKVLKEQQDHKEPKEIRVILELKVQQDY